MYMSNSENKYEISIEDANTILERTINFIQNCDNKASIFLGALGVVFTISFTTEGFNSIISIIKKMTTPLTCCNFIYLTLALISMISVIIGVINLIVVLGAKTTLKKANKDLKQNSKIYFWDIAKSNYETYKKSLLNLEEDTLKDDIISQIYINSCICKKKYMHYKLGLLFSLIGLAVFLILWILGYVWLIK